MLIAPDIRLGGHIALYNIRLEELHEKRSSSDSEEPRLEKILKLLPFIDLEKLKPSPICLKKLQSDILNDAKSEEWMRTKVLSIQYGDGFSFKEIWN